MRVGPKWWIAVQIRDIAAMVIYVYRCGYARRSPKERVFGMHEVLESKWYLGSLKYIVDR